MVSIRSKSILPRTTLRPQPTISLLLLHSCSCFCPRVLVHTYSSHYSSSHRYTLYEQNRSTAVQCSTLHVKQTAVCTHVYSTYQTKIQFCNTFHTCFWENTGTIFDISHTFKKNNQYFVSDTQTRGDLFETSGLTTATRETPSKRDSRSDWPIRLRSLPNFRRAPKARIRISTAQNTGTCLPACQTGAPRTRAAAAAGATST